MDTLNRAVRERIRFIDCLLEQYGAVNRAVIVKYFGLSVPQAAHDLATYKRVAPGNMEYDASAKRYVRGVNFVPLK